MLCMANLNVLKGEPGPMYLWSWRSCQSGKVSRSTLQADTQATVDGADDAIRWRAVVGSMSQDLRMKHWESDCAGIMRILLLTDCRSFCDHITSPTFTRPKDKRTGIELSAIRQMVWREPDWDPGRIRGEDRIYRLFPDAVGRHNQNAR